MRTRTRTRTAPSPVSNRDPITKNTELMDVSNLFLADVRALCHQLEEHGAVGLQKMRLLRRNKHQKCVAALAHDGNCWEMNALGEYKRA